MRAKPGEREVKEVQRRRIVLKERGRGLGSTCDEGFAVVFLEFRELAAVDDASNDLAGGDLLA